MPANNKDYIRKYNRERQVRVYPSTSDMAFIQNMRAQKPGMSKSAVAKYLIGLGVKQLTQNGSKNNF